MNNNPWIGRAISIIGILIMIFGLIKMTEDNSDSSNLIYTIIGLFVTIAGNSLMKKSKAKSETEN